MFSLEKYLIASASTKHSYLWGRKLSLAWHYFSSLQVLQLKSGFHSLTIKVTASWFKQQELFILRFSYFSTQPNARMSPSAHTATQHSSHSLGSIATSLEKYWFLTCVIHHGNTILWKGSCGEAYWHMKSDACIVFWPPGGIVAQKLLQNSPILWHNCAQPTSFLSPNKQQR